MDAPAPFLLALSVALAVPALAQLPALAQAAGDAHIVRPYRGDVLAIDGRVEPVRRPAYVAPYAGWRYVPVRAGQRIAPAFRAARYAVVAPAGLPPAKSGQSWVRYGKDLLLVTLRTGRVLRVASGRG